MFKRLQATKYGKVIDLESFTGDGRLTEPSDGKKYNWRKMISHVENLGRPLTKKEMENFRMK